MSVENALNNILAELKEIKALLTPVTVGEPTVEEWVAIPDAAAKFNGRSKYSEHTVTLREPTKEEWAVIQGLIAKHGGRSKYSEHTDNLEDNPYITCMISYKKDMEYIHKHENKALSQYEVNEIDLICARNKWHCEFVHINANQSYIKCFHPYQVSTCP